MSIPARSQELTTAALSCRCHRRPRSHKRPPPSLRQCRAIAQCQTFTPTGCCVHAGVGAAANTEAKRLAEENNEAMRLGVNFGQVTKVDTVNTVNIHHHGRVISMHVCLRAITLPFFHIVALICIPSTESTAFGESSFNICNHSTVHLLVVDQKWA